MDGSSRVLAPADFPRLALPSVDAGPPTVRLTTPVLASPGAPGRLSTGVPRLDALLAGGYVPGNAVLLYGPPFCGKQVLQQLAVVDAVLKGTPATYILHGTGAEAMSRRLRAINPRVAKAEEAGLLRYIDAHSHFLGESTGHPNAVYVQDPQDMAHLLAAAQAAATPGQPAGLLAIQSASTILLDLGTVRAFNFLRTVLGRTLRAGGIGLVSLQAGMHPESDVQMAKHICSGMIELRKKSGIHVLQVEGLETSIAQPGWIEYTFTPTAMRLTGSFATRTIR